MVRTSSSSDFCSSHFSVCLLDHFPDRLLKAKHSKRYVLKEASVTNTPSFESPDEQEENKL